MNINFKKIINNEANTPLLSLSAQTITYGIGVFGRQGIVYIFLPLLTRVLSQEEYGIVSVMTAFLAFINVLSDAGLPAATFRLYNDTSSQKKKNEVLGSALILFLSYAVFIGFLIYIFAAPISSLLLDSSGRSIIVKLISGLLIVMTLISFGNIILRIQIKPLHSSIQGIVLSISQISIALLLVVNFRLGAMGYWLGYLIGAFITLCLIFAMIYKTINLEVEKTTLKEVFFYALPMIPAAISLWALRLIDRGILTLYVGLEGIAIYELGYKIGLLAGLITYPLNSAWAQFAYGIMDKPNATETYKNVLTFVAAGVSFFSLCAIAFSHELISIMGPENYQSGVKIIPWVALAQIGWGIYPIASIGLHIMKKVKYFMYLTFIAAATNILLNLILIPKFGILGSAIATFISFWLLPILGYLFSQKFYSYPIDIIKLLKLFLSLGLSIGFVYYINNLGVVSWIAIFLRFSSLALFIIILLILGFLEKNEINTVKKVIRKVLKLKF